MPRGALTPQTSGWGGDGGAARRPRREGPRGGELQRGAPGVRPSPFVCPPRRSPLPKEGWHRGRREVRARGGGERGGEERRGSEHYGGWERLEGWRGRRPSREERPELPEKARRKKRRKETHPAPNTRVSPVTNRKVLPQEEVIGAVESSRSREPRGGGERARESESKRASARESRQTDRLTDKEPKREAGGARERRRSRREGSAAPGLPLPFPLLPSLNSQVSHLGRPVIQ